MKSESYIFLIWESARDKEEFLLSEIKKEFIIKQVYEIEWNPKNFPINIRRFYGPGKVGDVNKKTKLCGIGPFLLIVVNDPHPKFEKRRTSKGMELVNVNIFDAKLRYRKITGKGFAIHSSITKKETNDDLTLLLGKSTKDIENEISKKWDQSIIKIKSDLIGQESWKNINEFFHVLNSTVNYVIFRNFENLSTNFSEYEHNDIDILTDEPVRIPYIANGGKAPFNEIFPHKIKIGEKTIPIDFCYPEDGYYDEKWLKDVLDKRILKDGFFIPTKEDYFYTLFYHAVFHQKMISKEYKTKLKNLSNELDIENISSETFDDIQHAKKIIEDYMYKKGYHHTNSEKYKLKHNRILKMLKTSIMLWKTHGFAFLLTAIKGKIKRKISKPNKKT